MQSTDPPVIAARPASEWRRNALFATVVVGAVIVLGGVLAPGHFQESPLPQVDFNPADAAHRQVVEQIDRAFADQWAESDLAPAPPASDLLVMRRLSLALTGTVPAVEEVRRIESWPVGDRIEKYLAQLLADRRTSDYLAERLARAYVSADGGPFLVFRRRRMVSWLADELHRNAPYDEIVRQLIAETGFGTDKPAVNFVAYTIQPDNDEGPNPNKLAARVARAFLGVRIDCAECHDHPFESWKQRDFEGLAAYFGQTKNAALVIYDGDGQYEVEDRETGALRKVEPAVPFLPECVPAAGTLRQRLAAWVTHPENERFRLAIVNRLWALLFGRALVEPVDDLSQTADPPAALAILADYFGEQRHDLRKLIAAIVATRAFRLDSAAAAGQELTDAHDLAWAAFPLTRLRPEQVVDSIVQAGSLETIDYDSHIFTRIARATNENDFLQRYGDAGLDELAPQGGTIPQRLILLNGEIVQARTEDSLIRNAATRIAALAPDDPTAVEVAYLALFTRRPTAAEAEHFGRRLAEPGLNRRQKMEDLYWALINSTEFSWNH